MTNEERFKKYVEEHCKNCKNKHEDVCEIKIAVINDIVKTSCEFYVREEMKREKKKLLYTTSSKSKPLMKGLV